MERKGACLRERKLDVRRKKTDKITHTYLVFITILKKNPGDKDREKEREEMHKELTYLALSRY